MQQPKDKTKHNSSNQKKDYTEYWLRFFKSFNRYKKKLVNFANKQIRKYKQKDNRKNILSFIALLISVLAYWNSCSQTEIARESANAAKESVVAANKSIDVSEQSLRISNRAYVHAITTVIDTADGFPRIKNLIVNSGQTPAYNVKNMGVIIIDTVQCYNILDYENIEIKGIYSNGIIPPKSHGWNINPIEIPDQIIELDKVLRYKQGMVGQNKRFLKVYGWITYETIFFEPCSTIYSRIYDSERKGFSFCETNNKDYVKVNNKWVERNSFKKP